MTNKQLNQARQLIKNNPSLIWYTKAYDQLSIESILEHVLNYGQWEDFEYLKNIIDIHELADIFYKLYQQKRRNLKPETKHYFNLYFQKHAPRN